MIGGVKKAGEGPKNIMRRGGKDGIFKIIILQHFATPNCGQANLNYFFIPPHLMINNEINNPQSPIN